MFHNVLMTSLTPMCDKNEINCWENRPFTNAWPESKPHKPTRGLHATRTIKKKNKRNRTAYTTDQLRVLERTFSRSKYIDSDRRKELAECLKIGEKCVKVWFQNRRMKEKKESSESSDSSSECFTTDPVTPPPENINQRDEEYNFPSNNYTTAPHNVTASCGYDYKENVTSEAQIPYYQYETPYPNYYVPSYSNDFCRTDTNVYPTQYYPYHVPEYNYTNVDNHGDLKQDSDNIWSANTFDLNFF